MQSSKYHHLQILSCNRRIFIKDVFKSDLRYNKVLLEFEYKTLRCFESSGGFYFRHSEKEKDFLI
jgi:hypothetical protein